MPTKDWFVNDQGDCQILTAAHPLPTEDAAPYRLYRFLTDLEAVLAQETDDQLRLYAIFPLVRKLLNSATWLHLTELEPSPETGWNLMMLYDEPFFPLTIQLVAWAPGSVSEIHNHGTWGIVALLSGQEKNTFWQPTRPKKIAPNSAASLGNCQDIQPVGDCLLMPGDILGMMPNTIHQIEALGTQPTLSLNLYGETDFQQRFEFDPLQRTVTRY
jgi:predicted metal-dependent enzyme (double-stranded beta helix superfamily)